MNKFVIFYQMILHKEDILLNYHYDIFHHIIIFNRRHVRTFDGIVASRVVFFLT